MQCHKTVGGAVVALAVVLAACSSGKSPAKRAVSRSHPLLDPSKFSTTIDNQWLSMKPGDTRVFTGTKDGKPAHDVVTVTGSTQVIDGIATRVVEDQLSLDGRLAETTRDYYAQDHDGNVWYLGEDTAELDANGQVTSTEGTWRAGRDGARPGIVMEAAPHVGRELREEFYRGHAEDAYKVVDLHASATVPYGSYTGAVRTEEWTPLEPAVLDNKYYVRGIGLVREVAVRGPREELVLQSVGRPG